tara:strand:- start:388 stop:723 length:336 start_codon:yes stop_codon:yes gene_type:complete
MINSGKEWDHMDTKNINKEVDLHKQFAADLDIEVTKIADLLKAKNLAYGNSALEPLNVFSKLDSVESLLVRMDDKLARIRNRGIYDETEDTVDDLIGYLFLLKLALLKKGA